MNDLISRSALLAAYDKAHKGPPGGARKLIEEAPEAIVRCKDCKRARLVEWGDQQEYKCYPPATDGVPEAYLEPADTPWHEGDFYCADGERK